MVGLPAELYPQIGQSARMQFIKLRTTGYMNGSFGLPAELYPHIWFAVRQLLYYSIVAKFVNRFLKKYLELLCPGERANSESAGTVRRSPGGFRVFIAGPSASFPVQWWRLSWLLPSVYPKQPKRLGIPPGTGFGRPERLCPGCRCQTRRG